MFQDDSLRSTLTYPSILLECIVYMCLYPRFHIPVGMWVRKLEVEMWVLRKDLLLASMLAVGRRQWDCRHCVHTGYTRCSHIQDKQMKGCSQCTQLLLDCCCRFPEGNRRSIRSSVTHIALEDTQCMCPSQRFRILVGMWVRKLEVEMWVLL
jgi:hypothetical protein